jgi:hydrogenase maturation protein HypF
VDEVEINIVRQQIEKKLNSPLTSSCGRLFDAVSALIGVRGEIKYEAQAAIELEMVAYDAPDEVGAYPFSIVEQNGLSLIKVADLFSAILQDMDRKATPATIAARFHNTVARIIRELSQQISQRTGLNQVVLSGGVFQNRLLLRKTGALLEAGGLKVFTHRQVPTNDGGISLGQAVIANFATGNEKEGS